MRIRWVTKAAADLAEIASYLHENALAVANDILTEIYEGSLGLGDLPYVGRLAPDGRSRKLLLAKQYSVKYRITIGVVHIFEIWHTLRRPLP